MQCGVDSELGPIVEAWQVSGVEPADLGGLVVVDARFAADRAAAEPHIEVLARSGPAGDMLRGMRLRRSILAALWCRGRGTRPGHRVAAWLAAGRRRRGPDVDAIDRVPALAVPRRAPGGAPPVTLARVHRRGRDRPGACGDLVRAGGRLLRAPPDPPASSRRSEDRLHQGEAGLRPLGEIVQAEWAAAAADHVRLRRGPERGGIACPPIHKRSSSGTSGPAR